MRSDKTNPPPVFETGSGMETKQVESLNIKVPTYYDNTGPELTQGVIATLLSVGEQNSIKADRLVGLSGLSTTRQVSAEIERERNAGILILSSSAGYYLPETDEHGELTAQGAAETERFYRMMRAKGIATLKSAKHARLAVMKWNQDNEVDRDG